MAPSACAGTPSGPTAFTIQGDATEPFNPVFPLTRRLCVPTLRQNTSASSFRARADYSCRCVVSAA